MLSGLVSGEEEVPVGVQVQSRQSVNEQEAIERERLKSVSEHKIAIISRNHRFKTCFLFCSTQVNSVVGCCWHFCCSGI